MYPRSSCAAIMVVGRFVHAYRNADKILLLVCVLIYTSTRYKTTKSLKNPDCFLVDTRHQVPGTFYVV